MITFSPQCTLFESGPAFVQQPNVRSTMDIIWGSLVIIFLCSWSILHLCVPPQFRPLPPPKNSWETIRRAFFMAWLSFRRKFLWMVITIMVPELVLGSAVGSFMRGKECTKKFKAFQQQEKIEDEVDWTLTHSMYANMGGFVLRFPREDPPNVDLDELDGPPAIQSDRERGSDNDIVINWLDQFKSNNNRGYQHVGPFDWDTHSHNLLLAEGFVRQRVRKSRDGQIDTDGKEACARVLSGDTWTLDGLQLLEARRVGIIGQLPRITELEIQDKSKGAGVVNLLAIFQVCWLITQLVTRAAEERQSSQVEISALAFATCALVTYSLLFHQPKDVQTPTVVAAARCPSKEEFKTLATIRDMTGVRMSRHDTYAFPALNVDDYYGWSALAGLTIFGSVHIAAWNMTFPSYTEQILWRACAVYISCIPVITFPAGLEISDYINTAWVPEWVETVLRRFVLLGMFLFIPARLFLLVESFRSTYYLPPSSYTATWASNIPHIV